MPVITSPYPNQTVQMLNSTQVDAVGSMGRVVQLTDESYTVDPRDSLVLLTATTSAGDDHVLTFPATLPENFRCTVVAPAAPTGTDKYVTDGLAVEANFTAAGQMATIITAGGESSALGSAPSSTPGNFADSVAIGDGDAEFPTLVLKKPDAGFASVELRSGDAAVLRGRLILDGTETVILSQHDAAGDVVGQIAFNPTTGAISLSKATTIAAGGLTVTAGGVTISAGDLLMGTGARHRLNLPTAADDAAAAALVPPVVVGGQYTTAAGIVHQRMA